MNHLRFGKSSLLVCSTSEIHFWLLLKAKNEQNYIYNDDAMKTKCWSPKKIKPISRLRSVLLGLTTF